MTPNWSTDDLDHLDRFFTGRASAEERARAEALLAADPAYAERYHAAVMAIRVEGGVAPDPDAMWARFGAWQNARRETQRQTSGQDTRVNVAQPDIGDTPLARDQGQRRPRIGVQGRRVLGMRLFVAGAVLLLVLSVLHDGVERPSHPVLQFHTAPGHRSTVRLADGSTVMLAPATSLVVTPSTVTVTGEAYFTVTPHSTRPFVVRTRNSLVQVLGTRFSVRQYFDEARSQVVVEDGRVMLRMLHASRGNEQGTILSMQSRALVSDSGMTVTSGVAVHDYVGWTHGVLVFKGTPLRDVVKELSRVYGSEIRISDPALMTQSMLMEVPVSDLPLGRVLDAIGKVVNAHYTRDGLVYVLSPGRVVTHAPPSEPPRHQSPQLEQQYGR